MIYFEAEEIFLSVLHSFAYGFAFSLFTLLPRLLIYSSRFVFTLPKSLVCYQRITDAVKPREISGEYRLAKAVTVFLGVVTFFVGYILLSYYSLDGAIRAYTLLICVFSAAVTEKLICPFLLRVLKRLASPICFAISVILRIIALPIKVLLDKMPKTTENEEK